MLDLLFLATMFVVCSGIGLPFAQLLPERFRWRLLIAPTLGLSLVAVALPITYRAGLSILHFFWASLFVALVLIAMRGRRTFVGAADERRLAWIAAAACVVATCVMLAPRWLGGDQFSVFQGNHWDTFGYLESALMYARKPYAYFTSVTDYEVMRYPMLHTASGQITSRPSVHLLYAAFSRVAPGQAYRLYYPFLVFAFVQVAQVTMFILRNAFPRMSRWAWIAIAFVFPLGFWGQYVLDINAWSQIFAQPMLLLVFGLVIHALARPETALRDALRIASVLAVVVAGAFYVYPEASMIYCAALGPVVLVMAVYRIIRARKLELAPIIPFLGFLGVASVFLYAPQVTFLLSVIEFGKSTDKVIWWKFFQIFFYGRDGHPNHGLVAAIDFSAGLFGLYFATPKIGVGLLAVARRIAIVASILSLIGGLIAVLAGKIRDAERKHVALWAAATLIMFLPAARFAMQQNYWPAGKSVSYASPVFMTLLCIPVGFAVTSRGLRWLRGAITVFVVFQLAMGVTRIFAAQRADGIHYAPPYPAVQAGVLKSERMWDLRGIEALPTNTRVLLRPMDVWIEGYLMMILYSRRVPFAIDGPVRTYFEAGTALPGLAPPWIPDAEICQEGRSLIVRFADGRAPLIVAGSR